MAALGAELEMSDDLASELVIDPEFAMRELAEQIRPVAIGTVALLGLLFVCLLMLLVGLFLQRLEVSKVTATAKEIDAEKEWALEEFAPRESIGYDVKFGTFLANPLNSAKLRYVRCGIVFTVSDPDLFEATGLAQARARAAVVGILGTRTVEELSRPGGLDRARTHLRRALKSHFPEDLLLAVHFSEFIVE